MSNPWSLKFFYIYLIFNLHNGTLTEQLITFIEIIGVYYNNHTEHTDIVYRQNNVKLTLMSVLKHSKPCVIDGQYNCFRSCEYAAPCYPIEVPPNDPRITNRRCIDFFRSSAICGSGQTSVFFDTLMPREQINQLTSYIDASQVSVFLRYPHYVGPCYPVL